MIDAKSNQAESHSHRETAEDTGLRGIGWNKAEHVLQEAVRRESLHGIGSNDDMRSFGD